MRKFSARWWYVPSYNRYRSLWLRIRTRDAPQTLVVMETAGNGAVLILLPW